MNTAFKSMGKIYVTLGAYERPGFNNLTGAIKVSKIVVVRNEFSRFLKPIKS